MPRSAVKRNFMKKAWLSSPYDTLSSADDDPAARVASWRTHNPSNWRKIASRGDAARAGTVIARAMMANVCLIEDCHVSAKKRLLLSCAVAVFVVGAFATAGE